VQSALADLGYYRGRVDGVIGNGTRNAIRAFQRDNGLRATGRLDERLLDELGVG
jgi:peptidoglycan hydrolase-like protein with peptidoglycan-binding domain